MGCFPKLYEDGEGEWPETSPMKVKVGSEVASDQYCLMDRKYDGGGWMLLSYLTHPKNNFGGSVSPFLRDVGAHDRFGELFSRDWHNVFQARPGDEFMIRREDTKDWVRFEVSNFCGWSAGRCKGWNNKDRNEKEGSSHFQLAVGLAYDSNNAMLENVFYFNGCGEAGGCNREGVDGPGFTTNAGYTYNQGGSKAWGISWNGSDGVFSWGSATVDTPMSYWFR